MQSNMNSYGLPPKLPPNNAHQKYKPDSSVELSQFSAVQSFMMRSGLGAPGRLGPEGPGRKEAVDSFVSSKTCTQANMNLHGVPPTLPPNNAHHKYKPYSSVSQLIVHDADRPGGPWPLRVQGATALQGRRLWIPASKIKHTCE
jgi:hypothetical protein